MRIDGQKCIQLFFPQPNPSRPILSSLFLLGETGRISMFALDLLKLSLFSPVTDLIKTYHIIA